MRPADNHGDRRVASSSARSEAETSVATRPSANHGSGVPWVIWPLIVTGGFLVAYVVAGSALVETNDPRVETTSDGRRVSIGTSWPGIFDGCVVDAQQEVLPNCFRESVARDSIVKQPFSAYSALAYCLSGLLIFLVAWQMHERSNTSSRYLLWFGAVALGMGFGSFLFHGTLTSWGGWLDEVSMYLLLGFIISYDIAALRYLSFGRFVALFLGIVAVGAIASAVAVEVGLYVFIGSAVAVGVWVFVAFKWLLPRSGFRRSGRTLSLAVAILAIALIVWLASNPNIGGSPSAIPYHAFWHIFSAAFLLAYFAYFRHQRRLKTS